MGRRTARHWRNPLIAAAAVAAIAVVTAAMVTRGFAGSGQPASRPGGDITCADIRASASSVTVPITGGQHRDAAATVAMYFAGGAPPKAHLCASGTDLSKHALSDGALLGYVSLAPATSHRAGPLVWGAVGPDVDQVLVSTIGKPAGTSGSDGSDPLTAPHQEWMFASIAEPPWRIGDQPATVWPSLGRGWHGIAVQVPRGTAYVMVAAIDSAKGVVQTRRLDGATGVFTDNTEVSNAKAAAGHAQDATVSDDANANQHSSAGARTSAQATSTTHR